MLTMSLASSSFKYRLSFEIFFPSLSKSLEVEIFMPFKDLRFDLNSNPKLLQSALISKYSDLIKLKRSSSLSTINLIAGP